MKFLIPIFCFFTFFGSLLGNWVVFGDEISYHDLEKMNVSCYQSNLCMESGTNDYPYIQSTLCSCDDECWQYGTCCIDAPYRDNGPPIYECREKGMGWSAYFVVQRCSENTDIDSSWKSQCEEEWNGVYDILMLSPVTSLDTNTTYKNYYCLRCHETTDNFRFWDLSLQNIFSNDLSDYNGYRVTYSEVTRTSGVAVDVKPLSHPYLLAFQSPFVSLAPSLGITCNPNIVSDCPKTWTDKDVLDKCKSYEAIVEATQAYRLYKNAFCALCNDVSLDQISCYQPLGGGGGGGYPNFKDVSNTNIKNDNEGKNCKQVGDLCLTRVNNG